MIKRFLLVFALLLTSALAEPTGAAKLLKKPDQWYSGAEAKRAAECILSYQSDLGGWPKNLDTTAAPFTGKKSELTGSKLRPTFDNDATTDELRFLARIYLATKDAQYRTAFEKGVDYILKAQYPTGGWPQFYPPDKEYHRYITFNDDAMTRVLQFLQELNAKETYHFLDDARKTAAKKAFDAGIECILRCQIKVDGKLTAWCAQHDPVDLSPKEGRKYELISISGAESVGIVRLLMSLENPSPQIVNAIDSAVAWFEATKLKGIRQDIVDDSASPTGKNKIIVPDPTAPPLWARFYEIGTNKPIFSDRDGIAKSKLSDIDYERRMGYSWINTWPAKLLEKEYPAWKMKHP